MNMPQNYGTLLIQLKKKTGLTPASGAMVQIARGGIIVSTVYTDAEGDAFANLPAPEYIKSQIPSSRSTPYESYDVRVILTGYITLLIRGIQIFPGVMTTQKYDMVRTTDSPRTRIDIINIPPHKLISSNPQSNIQNGRPYADANPPSIPTAIYPIPNNVVIPKNITVHLGPPDSNAENVTVPYIEYLKNVASSEIYPTWPEAALRANILAQASLSLNRIYTEWYRSQGYDFQITSSPAYDQYFVYRRSTFETTDRIIDEIFTDYIVRANNIEPIFARYCDGYISQCLGLSQWGTVELANRYYTPLDILRNYYGENIYIKSADVAEIIPDSYPGKPNIGDQSAAIALLQSRLNRIAINYSAVPFIQSADGTYNQSTVSAIRAFQSVFGLTPTGELDSRTWYRILYIYTAVKKLAEADSEGERISNEGYPGYRLNTGNRGLDVLRMEIYLKRIGEYIGNNIIPDIDINGIYDVDTRDAVSAFQNYYGLPQTGIIDETTWDAIVKVYYDIPGDATPQIPPYPGSPIRKGDKGETVRFIQDSLNTIGEEVTEIPRLEVDGSFGQLTENAVKAFQQFYGLTADGIVGQRTWQKLNEEYSGIRENEDVG